ncbi:MULTISPECIES: hypothetical protein [unclassified Streptomyces]|uniref:hypothetical protein n=1 Tax=unclassified Streptomyces TaxID=2593676 RepID=UPI0004C04829
MAVSILVPCRAVPVDDVAVVAGEDDRHALGGRHPQQVAQTGHVVDPPGAVAELRLLGEPVVNGVEDDGAVGPAVGQRLREGRTEGAARGLGA